MRASRQDQRLPQELEKLRHGPTCVAAIPGLGPAEFQLLPPFSAGLDARLHPRFNDVHRLLAATFAPSEEQVTATVYAGRRPREPDKRLTEGDRKHDACLVAGLWLGDHGCVCGASLRLNLPGGGESRHSRPHVQLLFHATHGDFQKHGLGRLLTSCVLARAAEAGHEFATVVVGGRDVEGYWDKMGFRRVGSQDSYTARQVWEHSKQCGGINGPVWLSYLMEEPEPAAGASTPAKAAKRAPAKEWAAQLVQGAAARAALLYQCESGATAAPAALGAGTETGTGTGAGAGGAAAGEEHAVLVKPEPGPLSPMERGQELLRAAVLSPTSTPARECSTGARAATAAVAATDSPELPAPAAAAVVAQATCSASPVPLKLDTEAAAGCAAGPHLSNVGQGAAAFGSAAPFEPGGGLGPRDCGSPGVGSEAPGGQGLKRARPLSHSSRKRGGDGAAAAEPARVRRKTIAPVQVSGNGSAPGAAPAAADAKAEVEAEAEPAGAKPPGAEPAGAEPGVCGSHRSRAGPRRKPASPSALAALAAYVASAGAPPPPPPPLTARAAPEGAGASPPCSLSRRRRAVWLSDSDSEGVAPTPTAARQPSGPSEDGGAPSAAPLAAQTASARPRPVAGGGGKAAAAAAGARCKAAAAVAADCTKRMRSASCSTGGAGGAEEGRAGHRDDAAPSGPVSPCGLLRRETRTGPDEPAPAQNGSRLGSPAKARREGLHSGGGERLRPPEARPCQRVVAASGIFGGLSPGGARTSTAAAAADDLGAAFARERIGGSIGREGGPSPPAPTAATASRIARSALPGPCTAAAERRPATAPVRRSALPPLEAPSLELLPPPALAPGESGQASSGFRHRVWRPALQEAWAAARGVVRSLNTQLALLARLSDTCQESPPPDALRQGQEQKRSHQQLPQREAQLGGDADRAAAAAALESLRREAAHLMRAGLDPGAPCLLAGAERSLVQALGEGVGPGAPVAAAAVEAQTAPRADEAAARRDPAEGCGPASAGVAAEAPTLPPSAASSAPAARGGMGCVAAADQPSGAEAHGAGEAIVLIKRVAGDGVRAGGGVPCSDRRHSEQASGNSVCGAGRDQPPACGECEQLQPRPAALPPLKAEDIVPGSEQGRQHVSSAGPGREVPSESGAAAGAVAQGCVVGAHGAPQARACQPREVRDVGVQADAGSNPEDPRCDPAGRTVGGSEPGACGTQASAVAAPSVGPTWQGKLWGRGRLAAKRTLREAEEERHRGTAGHSAPCAPLGSSRRDSNDGGGADASACARGATNSGVCALAATPCDVGDAALAASTGSQCLLQAEAAQPGVAPSVAPQPPAASGAGPGSGPQPDMAGYRLLAEWLLRHQLARQQQQQPTEPAISSPRQEGQQQPQQQEPAPPVPLSACAEPAGPSPYPPPPPSGGSPTPQRPVGGPQAQLWPDGADAAALRRPTSPSAAAAAPSRVEESLRELQATVRSLHEQLDDREQQLAASEAERATLARNISVLYATAKEEMARRQAWVDELRAEVAQLRAERQRAQQQPSPREQQGQPGRQAGEPPAAPRRASPARAPPGAPQLHCSAPLEDGAPVQGEGCGPQRDASPPRAPEAPREQPRGWADGREKESRELRGLLAAGRRTSGPVTAESSGQSCTGRPHAASQPRPSVPPPAHLEGPAGLEGAGEATGSAPADQPQRQGESLDPNRVMAAPPPPQPQPQQKPEVQTGGPSPVPPLPLERPPPQPVPQTCVPPPAAREAPPSQHRQPQASPCGSQQWQQSRPKAPDAWVGGARPDATRPQAPWPQQASVPQCHPQLQPPLPLQESREPQQVVARGGPYAAQPPPGPHPSPVPQPPPEPQPLQVLQPPTGPPPGSQPPSAQTTQHMQQCAGLQYPPREPPRHGEQQPQPCLFPQQQHYGQMHAVIQGYAPPQPQPCSQPPAHQPYSVPPPLPPSSQPQPTLASYGCVSPQQAQPNQGPDPPPASRPHPPPGCQGLVQVQLPQQQHLQPGQTCSQPPPPPQREPPQPQPHVHPHPQLPPHLYIQQQQQQQPHGHVQQPQQCPQGQPQPYQLPPASHQQQPQQQQHPCAAPHFPQQPQEPHYRPFAPAAPLPSQPPAPVPEHWQLPLPREHPQNSSSARQQPSACYLAPAAPGSCPPPCPPPAAYHPAAPPAFQPGQQYPPTAHAAHAPPPQTQLQAPQQLQPQPPPQLPPPGCGWAVYAPPPQPPQQQQQPQQQPPPPPQQQQQPQPTWGEGPSGYTLPPGVYGQGQAPTWPGGSYQHPPQPAHMGWQPQQPPPYAPYPPPGGYQPPWGGPSA